MCAAMGGLYVASPLILATRTFFALTVPHAGMLATALTASAVSIAALWVSGFSLRTSPDSPPTPDRPHSWPRHHKQRARAVSSTFVFVALLPPVPQIHRDIRRLENGRVAVYQ
jgi:hypothetical protein